MPVTYDIHADLRLVVMRLTGPVAMQDFREALTQILKDMNYATDWQLLADSSGIVTNVTSPELKEHRDWRRQYPKYRRLALVAPSDYEYGIARMFELSTDGTGAEEVKALRSRADAYAWMGVQGPA